MLRRFLLALIVALGLSPLFVTGQAAAAQSSCAQWLHAADISNYNGSPNWQDVSTSGLAGLYILAADGTWTDPSFVPDVWGAQSIGLAWGGYYFARTNVDPVAAADLAIQAGFAKGVLPPVLDLELSGLSPDQTASWANTFGDVVLFITHRTMTLYTGAFYTWSQEPSLGQWPLWLSDYVYGYTPVTSSCGLPVPAAPSQWGDWSGWQFTSSGNAPGLGSPLDLSVFEADWFEEYTGASVAPPGYAGDRYPQPLWKVGSYGPKVVQIEQLLTTLGLYHGPLDGVYGPAVAYGVDLWQAKLGLVADSEWGPRTDAATTALFASLAANTPVTKTMARPTVPLHAGQFGANVGILRADLHVLGVKNARGGVIRRGTQYSTHVVQAVANLKASCHLKGTGKHFGAAALRCLDKRLKKAGH